MSNETKDETEAQAIEDSCHLDHLREPVPLLSICLQCYRDAETVAGRRGFERGIGVAAAVLDADAEGLKRAGAAEYYDAVRDAAAIIRALVDGE